MLGILPERLSSFGGRNDSEPESYFDLEVWVKVTGYVISKHIFVIAHTMYMGEVRPYSLYLLNWKHNVERVGTETGTKNGKRRIILACQSSEAGS